ncbi:MAG TPA: carbohydrate-binding protein [Cytophagales bacterium]|nr:carbohydrate-binding protein [Cytophagales bacterium]
MKTPTYLSFLKNLRKLSVIIFLFLNYSVYGQTIMFDDFTYSSVDDPQLSSFNKWNIVSGTSGPPEGAQYSRNNINFVADPGNSSNRLMTLSTTVNGTTKATTHSRIETGGYEYFEGTYAARVYFSENPFTYKDGNVQTFYTIVSSALSGDGSRYSELDFEYMAADKWGISPDNQVMYMTSWNRYIANPWQAWKRYFADQKSWAGWHTCVVSCTDGVNVKYWIDGIYFGSMSVTDSDGSSVYPRSNMHVAFANWIWNNVTGSSTANRTTTMQVDWVLHYKDQEISPASVNNLVASYRSSGLQRRNLLGQTYSTNPCTVPAQPGSISGNTTVSSGSSQTYSISAVNNATSYTWTLPSGWSGSSSSTSISTSAGSAGGTISVRANNACGTSSTRTLNVTVGGTSPTSLATNKPVTVSSVETASLSGPLAVDGSLGTRWASAYSDPQWIYVDLGSNYNINRVKINWEAAYGRDYQVQVSTNASTWSTIRTVTGNTSTTNDWTGLSGTGRYVRIYGTVRGTVYGYSIYELEVYGTPSGGGEGFTSRIEAEDYMYMGGIQTEPCSEGGLNVGYFDTGDWMSYNVNIPSAGTYKISYRVASTTTGKTLRLEKDGGATLLGTVTVPNTGGWQTWTTVSHNVTLPAGQYAVGLTTYTGGLNINWLEITNNLSGARLGNQEIDNSSIKSNLLYPNPIKNKLKIRNAFDETTNIQVLDFSGNQVLKSVLKKGEKEIDLSGLAPGGYLIKMTNKQTTKTERIIKE